MPVKQIVPPPHIKTMPELEDWMRENWPGPRKGSSVNPATFSASGASQEQIEARMLRQARVVELYNEGMSASAIAEAMNSPVSTIRADVRSLKQDGRIPKDQPPNPSRLEQIMELRDLKFNVREISDMLNISPSQVRADIQTASKLQKDIRACRF